MEPSDRAVLFEELCKNPQVLERKSSELLVPTLLEILVSIDNKELPPELIQPMLQGIIPSQFRGLLGEGMQSKNPLPHSLINAAGTTQLRGHLWDLAGWLTGEVKSQDQWLVEQKELIEGLELMNLQPEEALAIEKAIQWQEQRTRDRNVLVDKALLLAWNAGVAELIDRLSWAKEHNILLLGDNAGKYVTFKSLRHILQEKVHQKS